MTKPKKGPIPKTIKVGKERYKRSGPTRTQKQADSAAATLKKRGKKVRQKDVTGFPGVKSGKRKQLYAKNK